MFLLQTMCLPTLLTAVLPVSTLLSTTHHLTLNHNIKYNALHLLHTNVLIANNVLTNTANNCPSCQYSPSHIISHLTTTSNTTLFTSFTLMFLLQTMCIPTLLTTVLPASTLLSTTRHLTVNHNIKYNPFTSFILMFLLQ